MALVSYEDPTGPIPLHDYEEAKAYQKKIKSDLRERAKLVSSKYIFIDSFEVSAKFT
jgi:hypothetical protein